MKNPAPAPSPHGRPLDFRGPDSAGNPGSRGMLRRSMILNLGDPDGVDDFPRSTLHELDEAMRRIETDRPRPLERTRLRKAEPGGQEANLRSAYACPPIEETIQSRALRYPYRSLKETRR